MNKSLDAINSGVYEKLNVEAILSSTLHSEKHHLLRLNIYIAGNDIIRCVY